MLFLLLMYYVVAVVLVLCFAVGFINATDKNREVIKRKMDLLAGVVLFVLYFAFILNYGRIFSI